MSPVGARHVEPESTLLSRLVAVLVVHVGALRLELRLRAVHSLKEKRHIVKSLASHLDRTFGVAVAEVDHQDLWQRSTLGVAAVAPQPSQLDRILHSVQRAVRERDDVELLESDITYLETNG